MMKNISLALPLLLVWVASSSQVPLVAYQGTQKLGLHQAQVRDPSVNLAIFRGDPVYSVVPALHTYAPPFLTWKQHKNDSSSLIVILRSLTRDNLKLFLAWLGEADRVYDVDQLTGSIRRALVEFSSKLDGEHLRACVSDGCLSLLTLIYKTTKWASIPTNTLRTGLNGSHIHHLLSSIRYDCQNKELNARISFYTPLARLLLGLVNENYAELIFIDVQEDLPLLPVQLLNQILKIRPDLCQDIQAATLVNLLNNRQKAAILTAECVANINWQALDNLLVHNDSLVISPNLGTFLGSTAWESYNGDLPDVIINNLSPAQLLSYAKKCHGEVNLRLNMVRRKTIVEGLSLRLLKSRAMTLLRKKDELSWSIAHSNHQLDKVEPLLNTNWQFVSSNLFKGASQEDWAFIMLATLPEETKHFSPSFVQTIVNEWSPACALLLPDHITSRLSLPSASCFMEMNPIVQAKVLVLSSNLPPDILSQLTATMAQNWEYQSKPSESTLTGLEVLRAGSKNLEDMKKVLAHLGEDPSGENPCQLIDKFETLERIPGMSESISWKCFLQTGLDIPQEASQEQKYRHLYWQMPFELMKEWRGKDYFAKLEPEEFLNLELYSDFCAKVDEVTFAQLSYKVFDVMTMDCLMKLDISLTEEQIQELPSDIFRTIAVNELPPIFIVKMSPSQLRKLAADIPDRTPDRENNLGRILTAPMMKTFKPRQLLALTNRNWRACPPNAFAGIADPDQIHAIHPNLMANWSRAQILTIPAHAWAGLTLDQASIIGKGQLGLAAKLQDKGEQYIEEEVWWKLENRRLLEAPRRPKWVRWMVFAYLILIFLATIFITAVVLLAEKQVTSALTRNI